MKNKEQLTIEDAIENLSKITELEEKDRLCIADKNSLLIENANLTKRTIELLDENDVEKTISVVRETFRVILKYMRQIYRKELNISNENKSIEGIKTIMVLVGDAAKKLDKYTSLFKGVQNKTILKLKEYKQLQNFYRKKIAREAEEERVLSELIHPIEKVVNSEEDKKIIEREEVDEALDDVDVVKQDTEYEFFFLKKEDGERFFNRRLLRNIKLACDFGEEVDFVDFVEDPLIYIKNWQDKDCQISAKNILKDVKRSLCIFYKEAMRYKDMEIVSMLNKAIMALMLTSNPKNLLRRSSVKSCYKYFCDFQIFLRKILHSNDYQKMIAYPPNPSKKFMHSILELIHSLCQSLYTHINAKKELKNMINRLIGQGTTKKRKEKRISHKLQNDYKSIVETLKLHPNGPMFKIFDLLQEETIPIFDTLFLDNIPHHLYDIYIGEHKISHLRLPSPTNQEVVDTANIVDEFKGMLRAYSKNIIEKRHLLFNLQDRTSWKEYSRCNALEELQRQAEFGKNFMVTTLAMDTEFYHQLPPYHNLNEVSTFIEQLKEHLFSESSGFYFPSILQQFLFPEFIEPCIDLIHEQFFSSKDELSRKERQVFIDIFYLFLELKVIDIINPDSISFTCKDAIDTGSIANALLYTFLKMSNQGFDDESCEFLNMILFVPPLLIRERCIQSSRFNRLLSTIETIETALCDPEKTILKKEIKERLEKLYDRKIFDVEIKMLSSEESL